jgi:hypothetical protein
MSHLSSFLNFYRGITMNARITFAALVLLISVNESAQAEIYSGGPVYGGSGAPGGAIVCKVFNAGLTAVSISTRQIFDSTNASVTPTIDTCNVPLAANHYCQYGKTGTVNVAYSCRMIITGIDPNVSALAEIQGGDGKITVVPIHK